MSTTNFSHPRCYARALRDCSDKLSKEHYVSASVLTLLGDEHKISKASWLQPTQQSDPLPVGALASKILCEHHNSMLSHLDTCAKTFFSELLLALSDAPQPAPDRRVSINGDELERWVLKACCGALASGNLVEDGQQIVRVPPRRWLDILFSESPWEQGTGLHIRQATMTPYLGYAIGPAYVGEDWAGGGIEFAGVEMFVLLDPAAEKWIEEKLSGQVNPLIYRPGVIRLESPDRLTEIELRWQTWVPKKGVLYWSR